VFKFIAHSKILKGRLGKDRFLGFDDLIEWNLQESQDCIESEPSTLDVSPMPHRFCEKWHFDLDPDTHRWFG